MNLDSLLEFINSKLVESQNRPLNTTEVMVLQGIWQYQTYNQIAQKQGYSPGYFTNVVAPELWQRLSGVIGRRVTKKNCRALLESYAAQSTSQTNVFSPVDPQEISPSYPSGSVPLNSPFYIQHSTIEAQAYAEITKPGALVRIKAPRERGKTSLMLRMLNYANSQGYRTVSLNLEQIDYTILSDLNRFLRWLCANVSHQLQLQPRLNDYWDDDIGSKVSCTLYFRNYLLEQLNSPVVLALDEVNKIFEHPQVAKDFFPMLRSWYEEAKRIPSWQKLRLIVVHSTEVYVPLQLNQSPFNVGLPIQLSKFSLEQVQQLAQRYGIDWNAQEAHQLMALIGGHPALVHLALYHLSCGDVSMAQLLQFAPTSTGIYSHHLQHHWAVLEQQPELAAALYTVMNAAEPVQIEPILGYKLSSMGLIELYGNKVTLSCQLYRQYFENQQSNYRRAEEISAMPS
ncbi:AAA-like domain-containing protein [Calothrix membranacea FACHB-236]|nr:AAA-like domain-containing protein [Calothrix membranacea FACHB-236]